MFYRNPSSELKSKCLYSSGPQPKTSAETNITSLASVTANHARWQTRGMLLCAKKRVSSSGAMVRIGCIFDVRLGVLYLYMKTIERAHSPKHMWERIKLSNNYAAALQQVHFPLTDYYNHI